MNPRQRVADILVEPMLFHKIARSPEEALRLAVAEYNEPPGVVWWVCPAGVIVSSDPADAPGAAWREPARPICGRRGMAREVRLRWAGLERMASFSTSGRGIWWGWM